MTSALKIKESGSSGRRYTADGVQITSSTPGYVPYTVNDDNQYTVMKDVSLTYDPAGNLLTNGSWTYSWDNENRLTQVVSTSKLIKFSYDTQGRRSYLLPQNAHRTGSHAYNKKWEAISIKEKSVEELIEIGRNFMLEVFNVRVF